MSSAHQIILIKDLTTDSQGIADHPDLYDENGNKLGPTNIVGSVPPVYSKSFALLPKYNDYILTAICASTSCTSTIILEHSPDGINWCNCALSDGSPTCEVNCEPFNNTCTIRIVDVPLLQYVRVKVTAVADVTIDCTIMLTHTMNY